MMLDELNKILQRKAGLTGAEGPSTSTLKERKRQRTEEEDVTTNVSLQALVDVTAKDNA